MNAMSDPTDPQTTGEGAPTPLYQDTPIGITKLPKHEAKRVQDMTDEELEENTRTDKGHVDPAVMAEKKRRRHVRLGLPYP
jgi:hypothetical protein